MQDEEMTYPEYDKAWEDHAWNEMRKLLDHELPVQRRRRPGAWWIFGAGVAVGLFLAALAFFRLSPNETSAPQGALPVPMPGTLLHGEACPDAPAAAPTPAVAAPPQAAAGRQKPMPLPTPTSSSTPPTNISSSPPATDATPHSTSSEAAVPPVVFFAPTLTLPAPPLAPVHTSTDPRVALPIAAPRSTVRGQTSLYALAGSGSAQELGVGLSHLRQRPGSRWQWGYALGWRYRHSRSSGLAVVAFEEDLQEQTNQFSNKAIAGHFRNWHLAEGALFAERQLAPRWALGTGVYASLLLATSPTGAGLLQGRRETAIAPDSQSTVPATQTGTELRALLSRSVAPLRIGTGLHLRYAATPRLELLIHLRQQWTDDFPRNGLPDRPWSATLGARLYLQR